MISPQLVPTMSEIGQNFNRESGQSTPKTNGRLTVYTVNLPYQVGISPNFGVKDGTWTHTDNHTPLKRTRLPIPPPSQVSLYILQDFLLFVKKFTV